MLVSGGKILAIDQVYTDNETILGDGVKEPLVVNTDLIATTSSVSSALQYLRDHEPVVSAGQNINVVPVDVNGTIHYVVSASNIAPAVSISGRNGIKVVNEDDTTWVEYSGTDGVIYSAGKNIDIYQVNGKWYISADVPDVSEFVTNEDISKLSATIASTYLSASEFETYSADVDNRLTALESTAEHYTTNSAKYYSTYQTVYDNSAAWNEASAFSAHSGEFMHPDKLEYAPGTEIITGYDGSAFGDKDTNYVGIDGIKVDKDTFEISISANFLSASDKYLSANALDDLSGKWESVYNTVDANSAAWNAHSALSATKLDASESANFMKIADLQSAPENTISGYGESAFYYPPFPEIPEYSGKDGIKVENYEISISADYLSANVLDDLSGKWESVYDTVNSNSANWNEASAFAANSAKFVTSAGVEFDPALAYFLKKQEENVVWSGVDLTNLGKMYQISSLTPEFVSAGISADEQNNPIYVLSAAAPEQVSTPDISGYGLSAWKDAENNKYFVSANIVGDHGVSAVYDTEANAWNVGISASNAYAAFTAETEELNGEYTPTEYQEIYNVGNEIRSNGNAIVLPEGLLHITIRAKVENVASTLDTNYYDTTLTCINTSVSVQFDNSYLHTEYLNLDFDAYSQSNDTYFVPVVTNVPEEAVVTLEQIQIHKVIAGYTVNEGGSTYFAGSGINIQNEYINVKAGSGLGFNSSTTALEVKPGSGIYIDQNNRLSVKLGKGLAFSADGDIISIETNSDVNEVVDIVENLKRELDGKLTTNMNISDAKAAGCPWDGDTTNINNIAASFFTIPLQHNLTTASEISFFATQGLGQSDSDPLVIGILEYNFDYFEADAEAPNGVTTRSQTQWIADTGPIWYDTPDINGHVLTAGAGRYTYKLKNVTVGSASDVTGTDGTVYHNEFGPALRSDRAYYLALYSYSPNSYKYFLCDEGYAGGINNTDPAISFRKTGTNYTDANGDTHAITREMLALVKSDNLPFSMSGMEYWDRHTNEANNMKRPYVMIRNPRL